MNGMTATRLNTVLARQGRLQARPRLPKLDAPQRGALPLELGGKRDGFVYVPEGYRSGQPTPLVVMLHGAGGHARHALDILEAIAGTEGFVLVAPDSRGMTWDAIRGEYGPDITFIDQALAWVFERYAVDPARLVIGGFSDGASYALSLGIGNGDLVPRLKGAGYTVRYREFDGPHTVPDEIAREAVEWFKTVPQPLLQPR